MKDATTKKMGYFFLNTFTTFVVILSLFIIFSCNFLFLDKDDDKV